MDPKTLARWLILAAVVYFVLPFDVIPDFMGLPGRIDDFAVMALLTWLYRSHVQQFISTGSSSGTTGPSGDARSSQGSRPPPEKTEVFDAYKVLGVTRAASSDAIQSAYRARMQEYHPDKVDHLGEDLRKLAHERSQEIQRAYRQLRR